MSWEPAAVLEEHCPNKVREYVNEDRQHLNEGGASNRGNQGANRLPQGPLYRLGGVAGGGDPTATPARMMPRGRAARPRIAVGEGEGWGERRASSRRRANAEARRGAATLTGVKVRTGVCWRGGGG